MGGRRKKKIAPSSDSAEQLEPSEDAAQRRTAVDLGGAGGVRRTLADADGPNMSDRLEAKNIRVEIVNCVLAFWGVAFAYLEHLNCFKTCVEIESEDGSVSCELPVEDPASCTASGSFSLKAVVSLFTIALLIGTYVHFRLQAKMKALRRHVDSNRPIHEDSLWKTKLLPWYCLETIMWAIHVPPNIVDYKVNAVVRQVGNDLNTVYRLEDVVLLIMFFRVALAFKAYRDYVFKKFSTFRKFAQLLSISKIDDLFVIKYLMHTRPVSTISVFFLVQLWLCAIWIKVAEGPLNPVLSETVYNPVWFIIVSSTTVGYGDMSPITHIGRAVAMLCVVLGLVQIANLTAVLYQALLFTSQEHRTMSMINDRNFSASIQQSAARVIQAWFWNNFRLGGRRLRRECKNLNDVLRLRLALMHAEPHVGHAMKRLLDSNEKFADKMFEMISIAMGAKEHMIGTATAPSLAAAGLLKSDAADTDQGLDPVSESSVLPPTPSAKRTSLFGKPQGTVVSDLRRERSSRRGSVFGDGGLLSPSARKTSLSRTNSGIPNAANPISPSHASGKPQQIVVGWDTRNGATPKSVEETIAAAKDIASKIGQAVNVLDGLLAALCSEDVNIEEEVLRLGQLPPEVTSKERPKYVPPKGLPTDGKDAAAAAAMAAAASMYGMGGGMPYMPPYAPYGGYPMMPTLAPQQAQQGSPPRDQQEAIAQQMAAWAQQPYFWPRYGTESPPKQQ